MTPGERGRRELDAAGGSARTIPPFTPAQRRGLSLLLAIFLGFIFVGLIRKPVTLPDPLPDAGPLADQLASRLDPNTADATSLAALPQMGLRRAQEIVAYRERVQAREPGRVVFQTLDDLMRVRGIGHALARLAEPHLVFPDPESVTQPASRPD